MAETKVTKQDLREKFSQLEGGLGKAREAAAPSLPMVAVGLGVAVFAVGLLLGFRMGHKRSAIVEIKRI
ncbi:MAG: hypothetical protein M0Z34_12075 [Nitrospiraceae bacterium]|nr:hypothetical protein [Nitrospiraceae bacterium]